MNKRPSLVSLSLAKVTFLLIFSACSHNKVNVEEALKRESKDLKEFDVTYEDKSFTYKVKARSLPTIGLHRDSISFYYSVIDIGAIAPMECFFYPSDIAPASALKIITDRHLQKDIVGGVVAEKKVSFLKAGEFDSYPYIMLHTGFRVGDEKKPLVGHLKTVAGVKDIGNVVCSHNEMGYFQTFEDNFKQILASMDFPKLPKAEVKYKNIKLISIKDIPVGFSAEYVGQTHAHQNSWVEKSSLIVPLATGEFTALDELAVEVSNKEGILAFGLYKSDENGKNAMALQVVSNNFKNYLVSGTKDEKKVQLEMKTHDGVYSNFEVSRRISRSFFQQDLKAFSIPVFAPDVNYAAPTMIQVRLEKKNEAGGIVKFTDGNLTHHAVIQKDGTEEAVTYNQKDVKIEGKRIFKGGAYPKY